MLDLNRIRKAKMTTMTNWWLKPATKMDWLVGWLIIMGMVVGFLLLWAAVSPSKAADMAIGDSIALGTGRALHVPTRARVGASSCAIIAYVPDRAVRHMVISAGINDGGICDGAVRIRVHARRVTWVLPAPINAGALAAWRVVKLYGDGFVSYACRGPCTRRNFHPASYAAVAKAVRRDWNTHR